MKTLILTTGIFIAFNGFAMDACEEYGAKAVSCYEKGQLVASYDETGANCGDGYEESVEGSFWQTSLSENTSIKTKLYSSVNYNYPGGSATDIECGVSFINANAEACSFELFLSLGSEDGLARVTEFNCR